MSTTSGSIPTHIDVAVEYLNSCSDAFGRVAAILSSIEEKAPEYSHLRALAGAGLWIARDFENLADCWREEVQKGGIQTE